MKTFLVSAIAALAFLYQPALHAQTPVPVGAVKLGKILPEGIKSPEYQIMGGPQKRAKIGTWLEVEVEFETLMDDIPELKFDYTVQIENKLLTGSVTHVNIPKGKDHYSVVYIAPRTLEKLTGGKPLTSASVQNVQVTITSADGVQLADGFLRPPQGGKLPNLPKTPNLVLNKNETPFAPLFYDRYEAIKAGAR
jgi:hypothetical protein